MKHAGQRLLFPRGARLLVVAALVAAVLPLGPPASADTTVGGLITSDTTWTAANSPYIVTSSVLVVEGVTLTIQPGVRVKFQPGKGLQVEGQLIARGTAASPIVFTSNQASPAPGDWVNILFTDTSVDATYDADGNYLSGSILQDATVEYGGGGGIPAVTIISSSALVDHATLRYNSSSGIGVRQGSPRIASSTITNNTAGAHGGGVYVENSTVTLSGNTVSRNAAGLRGGGVYVNGGTATLRHNTISNNTAVGYDGGGVDVEWGTATLSNNTISSNTAGVRGGGVYVWAGTATVSGSTISNNSAGHGGGVYVNGGTVTLSGSTISNNSAVDGGGIWALEGTVALRRNQIAGNAATQGQGGGVHVARGQPVVSYNNFSGNTPYDVYNGNPQGTPHVDATSNWWGSPNRAEVEGRIYDWFDDATLGIVDFIPFLAGPAAANQPPTASFTYTPQNPVANQAITFDASASQDPEGGIVSYRWDWGDGGSGAGKVATHAYSSAGNYTVTLTATDADYAIGSATRGVAVAGEAPPGITVRLEAPAGVPQGRTFRARLNVPPVMNLDTYQFDLSYDPAVLQVTGVMPGLIDSTALPVDMWGFIPPGTPGTIRVLGNLPGAAGVTGEGYIAQVEFRGVAPPGGDSAITLPNGGLWDRWGNAIAPVTWLGGSVRVLALGDANGDGQVNMGDVITVERTILGLDPALPGADVNGDGQINMGDVTKIERLILGLD